MRTFQPAPQTITLLTDIESVLVTKNANIRMRTGVLPDDPEQRAFHQALLDLLPLVTGAQTAIRSYQAAYLARYPPAPAISPTPIDAGWGVG